MQHLQESFRSELHFIQEEKDQLHRKTAAFAQDLQSIAAELEEERGHRERAQRESAALRE